MLDDMRFSTGTKCRAYENGRIIADKKRKSYNDAVFVGLWYFSRWTPATHCQAGGGDWEDAPSETLEMY